MCARTFERLAIFFSLICLVILSGYFWMPATMQWPYGLSGVPSSNVLTMTAFLPAIRPFSSSTTLPAFRNFGAFLDSDILYACGVRAAFRQLALSAPGHAGRARAWRHGGRRAAAAAA
jgi:hypothetical protein